MSAAPAVTRVRARARVEGVVQGVGFRPFVFRLAHDLALGGYVLNDERGVLLEIEGQRQHVDRFLKRLIADAPPLASVQKLVTESIEPRGEREFSIAESELSGEAEALVSTDTATCEDCLEELFDHENRRYRYPFINCTNCGPRFTIVRGVPYDRPQTTMAGFEMCARCRLEYDDPLDRRFHAQPNACPDCGPRAWLVTADGADLTGCADAVSAAASALVEGRIVAVKGIGGFHLACRADDEHAVSALRARKHREDKPFALMAPDLDHARRLVRLTGVEEELMSSPRRPIVIAVRRPDSGVAEAVAPGSADLGVLLPYSPLHHLLLADAGTALVLTSGNISDEPIAYRDEDALERLATIADLFLLHDRPIETRTDDSVLRAHSAGEDGRPILIRRSRGYVPESIELPRACAGPMLGCGAELKNTFCVAKGLQAWVGHHIGDLENYETLTSFREGIEHFRRLFSVEPEVVVHDLHPEYLSTKYALERSDMEHVGVQHHHAHLAACLAEHGETGPALGAIYDGTGWGPDGSVWGGEILAGGLQGFVRVGMLIPVRLPGGEAAIREPWRMACSWLRAATGEERPSIPPGLRAEVDQARWDEVCELARTGLASPLTTSAGRLFDAVAALVGIRSRVNYEGQAAVELEAAADPVERESYPLRLISGDDAGVDAERDGDAIVLDARELIAALIEDLEAGAEPPRASARFHNALAAATAEVCGVQADRLGLRTVVISGGVFQNRLLMERTAGALRGRDLRVMIPERLPPNDGGISYGQVAVAAARLAAPA